MNTSSLNFHVIFISVKKLVEKGQTVLSRFLVKLRIRLMVLCLSANSLIEILSWPEIISELFEELFQWKVILFFVSGAQGYASLLIH